MVVKRKERKKKRGQLCDFSVENIKKKKKENPNGT